MKLPLFIALLSLQASFVHSQVIGGRGNSDMTPTVAEPAKISSGGFSGDINLFSGAYGASIPMGSVSTPGGLAFSLSFNYNSSFTVGATPPIATGIPYGEGWNLNIPTISVETEAFNNFTYQQYCDENGTNTTKLDFVGSGIDPKQEGDLYWYSPFIDIPGVASGRAIFKYIDVADDKTAVFVLNSFESQVELRFNQKGWTVITADGTQYVFQTAIRSFSAPANRRTLYYDQAHLVTGTNTASDVMTSGYAGNAEQVVNSITPKTSYNLWYCDIISHRNMPMQAINFVYEKYGAFNYFKEFAQSAYKQAALTNFAGTTYATHLDTTYYSDLLLLRVESYSVNSMVQQLKLSYATNKPIVNSNSELIQFYDATAEAGRLDSLYSYQTVYDAGIGENFGTDWQRYQHVKINSTTATETPNAANPYLSSGGYVRSSVSSSGEIPFSHSFLETPRIGTTSGQLIPGDIYEIRTKINRSSATDLRMGNGTLDISVVTGNLNNPAGTNSNTYSGLNSNTGIYYPATNYDLTRGIPLFSTFNMAMKWTLSYQEGVKNTSNFFVMPNVPSKFGGFNIQIGPGNADVDLSATPGVVDDLVLSNIPNAREAYAFKTTGYALKSAANLPACFGVGLPWGMMIPVYKSMISVDDPLFGSTGNPNDAFKFWWNTIGSTTFSHANEPTKLDATVRLDEFELRRYSKNPYMLVSVEQYTVNGEVGGPITTGLKLTAKKALEYTYTREQVLENYAYAASATLQYKPSLRQIHILLKAVRDIPVITTTDTTQYLTTFLGYSSYSSTATTYNVTQPLNGYTGKLLTRFVDHLGGITQVEYYPVTDSRTYYTNRFVKDQYCDAVVTTPAFGLSKAVTIHPVVKYILKNDEQDLVKNGTASSNNSHKRWLYDFDASARVFRQTELNNTNAHFYNGRKSAYDIGFRTVSVYGPTLVAGGSSFVNKTVYEHYGYKLTSGSGTPAIEDYLYHGKLKSIRQYDVTNQLFEEKLTNYAYTLAFKNGYTRPNLMREELIFDQDYDNPGGNYEYKDYYLNQTPSVTVSGTTYTGTATYPFLNIPVFTGKGEDYELPKFLDFYYYASFATDNPEYALNSYFIKKTEDITRTYDDYLSKEAAVSGTTTPVVVSPNPNPFGTGHVNPRMQLRVTDSTYIVEINTADPKDATDDMVANSPLSDTVLYQTIITSNLSSDQKTEILLAQLGLDNTTWFALIDNYGRFQPSDLITLINFQPYFSDIILDDVSGIMDSGWDDKVVEAFYTRNEYLSYPVLLKFTDPDIVDYIASGTFTTILKQQPQMPEDILLRIVNSPYLAPTELSKIFQYQVLMDDVYTAIIGNHSIDNTTIDEIIESGMSYPSEATLLALMERDPQPNERDWTRIATAANRELEGSVISALDELFHGAGFLTGIGYKGNPLTQFCNGATKSGWNYIETTTSYEYYEADYRGISNGRAYKVLMGLEDIPARTVSLTDFFGSGGTKTIANLCLKHEPSWQLFSATTSSVHLPTAKQEEQYFYLYDLKNRYDRYWYNYDIKTVNSELTSFAPVIIGSDTLAYTGRWDNAYVSAYLDDSPENPKYDGMTKSRQYNMRSTPFQKTTITKSQRDEPAMERSEYYFYDSRWVFTTDFSTTPRTYPGPTCPPTGTPTPDPTGCAACMYWKYGTATEFMEQLPNDYCLWSDPVIGFYACPYGVNMTDCREGAELIDCKPTLGENNMPDPVRYLPPGAALGKTLQLRSTIVQMDTIMGILNTTFASKRFDRSNRYIVDFNMQHDGADANGFAHPYRMFYPYDTLTTTTILERNEHLQPALVQNPNGIKTRYYYAAAKRYWNTNSNCTNVNYNSLYSYLSVDAPNIGLPIRVTVGYTRTDSLSTTFQFSDAGQVKKMTNPSGHYFDYTFDGFQRLTSVTENGTRLLSRNAYSQWGHDGTKTFDQRTDQNYVFSIAYSNYVTGDTSQRELQKAFLDPLGRTAGVARAYVNDAGTSTVKIYSGSVTYDNWGRAVETRKPFRQSDTNPFNYRNNLTVTLKSTASYDNDPASLASRGANFGVAITDQHTVKTSTAIVNYIYASCELGLNNTELQWIMKSGTTSGFRFRRTSVKDQDDKETVTYTNAFGQQVATLSWSTLNEKVVTLFVYDSYGNLTRTVNPTRQLTEYLYNIAGQLVKETSVDAGTKRYIYNKLGLVSGIQNDLDRAIKNGSNISTPRYRQFTYDDYGKPTGQYLVTTSYHLDAFCFANSSVGTTSTYVTDGQGQPHYFRYTFSNRSSMDWLNTYSTLDPVNVIPITTHGVPSGTSIAEKTTLYGTNPAVPSTLGKITETKSYDLSGTSVQKNTFTYDAQDRLATQEIRQHPTNEATNDSKLVKAKITYTSYNFRGSLTEERLDIGNDGSTEMQYFYTYDRLNRLSEVRAAQDVVAISSATKLATYTYDDERGSVAVAKLSVDNTSNTNVGAGDIEYSYDDRDRLTEIGSALFYYQLFYDDQVALAYNGTAVQQSYNYNGNVNATQADYIFGSTTNSVPLFAQRTNYGYSYDRLNRLTQADATVGDFVEAHVNNTSNPTPADAYRIGDEALSYDKIGNLLTLLRVKPGATNDLGLTFDDFIYTYTSGKNRLVAIDGQNGSSDRNYTYDANGNVLTDDFRGISATTYGRESYAYNLTKGSDAISYLYGVGDTRFYKKVAATAQTTEEMYIQDALGHDLSIVKFTTVSGTVTTTQEYFVFGTERIARVQALSGGTASRIYNNEAIFFQYDHLGNTRVAYKMGGTGASTPTIVNALDYYAYGKIIRQYDNGDGDRYLTTMHERDAETGLDYRGARYYDSDVARFLSTDPLASKYPGWSTYNYVMGNPVMLIDPTGKGPGDPPMKTHQGAGGTQLELPSDAKILNKYIDKDHDGKISFDGGKTVLDAKEGDIQRFSIDNVTYGARFRDGKFNGYWDKHGNKYTDHTRTAAETVSIVSDHVSLYSSPLELSSATYRLTRMNGSIISPKLYTSGWAGGSAGNIATYRLSSVGTGLGYGLFGISAGINIYGAYKYVRNGANDPNAIHPGLAATNVGWGYYTLVYNPIAGVVYTGVGLFYPGGWAGDSHHEGAIRKISGLTERNTEILGPTFNLHRDF